MDNTIKIRLNSSDLGLLDQTCEKLVNLVKKGSKIIGPVVLPNAKKDQTVYKRMIEIINPSPSAIESLINMKMSLGVNIDLKQFA